MGKLLVSLLALGICALVALAASGHAEGDGDCDPTMIGKVMVCR